jgi:ubiquinone/menaquinone biosynthesis C-methylase UbiE
MANLYDRFVLPTLINWAMTSGEAMQFRARHVPKARGAVLEIGIGSGLNLPFYTNEVTRLYGVDPSAELLAMAKPRAAAARFPVELFQCAADRIPLADASIDTVLVTWALCSILDPADTLREMRRILKPGGTPIFVEHGLSPDAGVRKWQNRLTPVWRRFAGGCHLNRKMDDLVREAGFTVTDLRAEYVRGPRVFTFIFEGCARK